jgi:Ser/Thr protein kinase RdoA (MazF antagonist)
VAHGLTVGAPQTVLGQELVSVGPWCVEAETFVRADRPPATWESYVWMFRAMGHLHRALDAGAPLELPPPEVATYASPDELRTLIATTAAAVASDEEAAALAADVRSMLDPLERQWTSPERLPRQVIHGDVRLGNVARATGGGVAYFDFGFAARRPRVHDLAYALFWIVLKPDDTGRAGDFDWRGATEFIDAYEDAAGAPLDEQERRSIGPYLAAVPMYLAAIASSTADPCDRIKQETRSLEIARWVLDHPDEVAFLGGR